MEFHASVRKVTCDWTCRCQCHPRSALESPCWLNNILGSLFYSHTGTPCLGLRPCNYSQCIQRESALCQLTYHLPRWMLKRTFTLTASCRDLGGIAASWSVGIPRCISASHDAWRLVEQRRDQDLRALLLSGKVSVACCRYSRRTLTTIMTMIASSMLTKSDQRACSLKYGSRSCHRYSI